MTWAIIAVALAAIGTLGSLYLSLGMGLKACPLCFYKRTFIMSAVAVLSVGLLVDRSRADLLCLLCLPLSVAGLGVAAFHEYLSVRGQAGMSRGDSRHRYSPGPKSRRVPAAYGRRSDWIDPQRSGNCRWRDAGTAFGMGVRGQCSTDTACPGEAL